MKRVTWIFLATLLSPIALATPIVECDSSEVSATIDQLTMDVYMVRLKFSGGTGFNFQTNGVVRSDRGFASMGSRGIVYGKNEQGQLTGWVALGSSSILADLTCTYLR